MVKHSRKMRGGVVSLPDIDKAVETVNELASQLKAIQTSAGSDTYGMESSMESSSSPAESSSTTSSSLDMSDYNSEPAASSSTSASTPEMSFKTDKDYKYTNPVTSVKLSYPRIIMLLQKLISQNPTSNRKEVLEQLQAATSQAQVQSIINNSNLRLAANYVMGGKTKKRGSKRRGGKRTMRR
jgi:hypothetical protein